MNLIIGREWFKLVFRGNSHSQMIARHRHRFSTAQRATSKQKKNILFKQTKKKTATKYFYFNSAEQVNGFSKFST